MSINVGDSVILKGRGTGKLYVGQVTHKLDYPTIKYFDVLVYLYMNRDYPTTFLCYEEFRLRKIKQGEKYEKP